MSLTTDGNRGSRISARGRRTQRLPCASPIATTVLAKASRTAAVALERHCGRRFTHMPEGLDDRDTRGHHDDDGEKRVHGQLDAWQYVGARGLTGNRQGYSPYDTFTHHSRTAPIRICDNGGWTRPWFARREGVFNIAVRPAGVGAGRGLPVRDARRAAGPRGAQLWPEVRAGARRPTWGPHPLLEAAFREIRHRPTPISSSPSDRMAPAGASTGTSASSWSHCLRARSLGPGRRTPQENRRSGHRVRTVHLGQQSGVQDHSRRHSAAPTSSRSSTTHAGRDPDCARASIAEELERRLALESSSAGRIVRPACTRVSFGTSSARGPDCPELDALRRRRGARPGRAGRRRLLPRWDPRCAQHGGPADCTPTSSPRCVASHRDRPARGGRRLEVNGAGGGRRLDHAASDGRPAPSRRWCGR